MKNIISGQRQKIFGMLTGKFKEIPQKKLLSAVCKHTKARQMEKVEILVRQKLGPAAVKQLAEGENDYGF